MHTYEFAGARVQRIAAAAALLLITSLANQAAADGVEFNIGSTKDAASESTGSAFRTAPWGGLYAGAHAGYQWSSVDTTDTYAYVGNPAASTSGSFGGGSFLGGVQAGYNIQKASVVYGLEADLGYLNLSSKSMRTLPVGANNLLAASYAAESGLYGDVTVRGGLAVGRVLFYVKGGLALLDTQTEANYAGLATGHAFCFFNKCFGPYHANSYFGFTDNATLLGWTVGVGGEYSLTRSLSAKFEYQHLDFGDSSVSHSGCSPSCRPASIIGGNASFSSVSDAIKIGINYHFNPTSE